MAGLAETGGGIMLALGLATPLAAAIVVGVMTVAIVSVHLKHGFFTMQGGYEFPMVLGLSAVSVAFTGPGRLSADALFGLDLAGAGYGIATLFVGLAAGGVQLMSRHSPVAHPQSS